MRRLYALERMVQVLHFNMGRIYDLWGIFLSHVLEVLASSKAALRTAAMDAVGKAITGALARPIPAGACFLEVVPLHLHMHPHDGCWI